MIAEVTQSKTTVAYGSTIEAVAYGLTDGGVSVVTGYSGFHAQEIIAAAGGSVSINERTAYSVAWGAALAGSRSAVVLKNVGLNDAADPFVNSINLRTSAGLVVVVLDDVEVAGSQCRLDSRHYFDLAPGLWLEPMSAVHAYECARNAARWSEELQVPVVIRLTNASLRSTGKFQRIEPEPLALQFRRDPTRGVAHPINVAAQRSANQERSLLIERFVESQFVAKAKEAIKSLAFGSAMPPSTDDCNHIWTYPIPSVGLRQRLRRSESVRVYEAGSKFASKKIREIGSEMSVDTRDSSLDCNHSGHYRITDHFKALFSAIRSIGDRIVVGDLGSYTLDQARTIDACLCYGASIATAIGCSLGSRKTRVICVTGDAAYLHSGRSALEEAVHRNVNITAILIDNGGAVSTGGQAIPAKVQFPATASVTQVSFQGTSANVYRKLLHRMNDHLGVNVLHVKV